MPATGRNEIGGGWDVTLPLPPVEKRVLRNALALAVRRLRSNRCCVGMTNDAGSLPGFGIA